MLEQHALTCVGLSGAGEKRMFEPHMPQRASVGGWVGLEAQA
jgi:hypothetical protein